jgi:uncharacterized Fe-S radical SAM superfamily protein PflX
MLFLYNYGLFFEVSNLHIIFCQNNQIKILTALVFYLK